MMSRLYKNGIKKTHLGNTLKDGGGSLATSRSACLIEYKEEVEFEEAFRAGDEQMKQRMILRSAS